MRPSRHSVLPAATLPRCHAAPLLCCCAGPMPCYCAFPLPRCRSAVLPRCCAAVLPRYRAAVLSACAGCRTQPIVRVYTFGGRGTVEQEEMQTWERDTGVRSPGHADNGTPSEVATSHHTPSLHAGDPLASRVLRSSVLCSLPVVSAARPRHRRVCRARSRAPVQARAKRVPRDARPGGVCRAAARGAGRKTCPPARSLPHQHFVPVPVVFFFFPQPLYFLEGCVVERLAPTGGLVGVGSI